MTDCRASALLCENIKSFLSFLKISSPLEDIENAISQIFLLLPFNSGLKSNIRDGKIERILHGAQHACRVALFIKILSQAIQLFDNTLSSYLTDETIKIMQIVGLLHDVARKNDFEDLWENESAETCRDFLVELGVEPFSAENFSNAIAEKENGGLFGVILQSADCLDIVRCRKRFHLDKMALFPFFAKHQALDLLIGIVKEGIAYIDLQYDLSSDVEICLGEEVVFLYRRQNVENRLVGKVKYEQADSCFLMTKGDLIYFPFLYNFYNHNKYDIYIKPDQSLKSKQEYSQIGLLEFIKCMLEVKSKFPKQDWKIFRSNIKTKYPHIWSKRAYFFRFVQPDKIQTLGEEKSDYYFEKRETAQCYLGFLKLCWDDSEILNQEVQIKQIDSKEMYGFSMGFYHISLEWQMKLSTDVLIKSVRTDAFSFVPDLLKSLMLTSTSLQSEKAKVRLNLHKQFTVFANGVYEYEFRDQRFNNDEDLALFKLNKAFRSAHQSTSLSFFLNQVSVFAHDENQKNKLVTLLFDPFDNEFNRLMIYMGGTLNRPYEFHDKAQAEAYFRKVVEEEQKLFGDYQKFKMGILKHANKMNEALFYLRWNILTSSVGVASDTFEARCIAQHFAKLITRYLQEQYKQLGKIFPQDYDVPIVYYLPYTENHLSIYTKKQQVLDELEALAIFYEDDHVLKKIKEGHPEFLFLLDETNCLSAVNKTYENVNLLIYLLEQGHFELVNSIFEKSGLNKTISLTQFLQNHLTCEAILHLEKSSIAQIGRSPLMAVYNKNRMDLLPILHHQLNIQDQQSGNSLLIYTVEKKLYGLTSVLLKSSKINVNQQNHLGVTALMWVIKNKSLDLMAEFLGRSDIQLNLQDREGKTALMFAVETGDANLVKHLIQQPSIDMNLQNQENDTALHIALSRGLNEIAELLINYPNINLYLLNKQNYSVLRVASHYHQFDLVKKIAIKILADYQGHFVEKSVGTFLIKYALVSNSFQQEQTGLMALVNLLIKSFSDFPNVKIDLESKKCIYSNKALRELIEQIPSELNQQLWAEEEACSHAM